MDLPAGYLITDDKVTLRYAIWSTGEREKRGSVLLLNGRAEFLEKHVETAKELNRRGFDVYSLDWRGQGGSSRLLPNPHKCYVASYEDYLRDLTVFYRWIVEPRAARPLVMLAHSLGGHIALRFLHGRKAPIDRAVFVSPMMDIHTAPFPMLVARVITRLAVGAGWDDRYCPGGGDYAPTRQLFENNPLTSDPNRFRDTHDAIAASPRLATGYVTWGWLAATFASIDLIQGCGFAEAIKTPLMIVGGQDDRIVRIRAEVEMAGRLPDCRLTLIPNARHEILKETDAIRAVFWEAFDNFVDEGA